MREPLRIGPSDHVGHPSLGPQRGWLAGRWGSRPKFLCAWLPVILAAVCLAAIPGARADPALKAPQAESVAVAMCRLIDDAAEKQHVPAGFLTRLIWQESSFRTNAVSSAGAQGIAQFMPGTASDRGLEDPFDPEQAIPASALLLADLSRQFGNLGLAAAAYNGGPARVSAWLRGTGSLPEQTRDYVLRITGQSADEWAEAAKSGTALSLNDGKEVSCLELAASLRRSPNLVGVAEAALAPWGVQLAGNFSKALALSSFERARQRYASILGDVRPMIIGTRLLTRGYRAFYRVRVPAAKRDEATALCGRIHAAHGSCVVLRS